ncbi:RGCVC family protein [Actinomycetospora termitidis]|uniref:RGCVC family protein n=1 Tax=Actinomycetospora termitidis TaxID=3053470 RepID=A0ABT7MG76_9PSEU|nr:RGCVC family protein [Actinomycetospora sp. Odt1-22]MDL5159682.1 RGCVC family protein [Actinomycetospora sp. Odt1-22]
MKHESTPGTNEDAPTTDPTCAMCPHPWSEHDALGRRFCTATQVGVWSRGCICTPPTRR